ncbi:hypothetical protein [Pseudomonas sp. OTU5201]|uniref:hypothetical protein n=1 Tax=Pseudomonas sp. OTU5201 TaxID=3043850 RepID=UPI00313F1E85
MIDTQFDDQLLQIAHLAQYPNLLPWVGSGYRTAGLKVLLLGESHYLPPGVSYHHDPATWYAGLTIPDAQSLRWMKTRGIIQKGLASNWKGASKTIYRHLSSAAEAGGFASTPPVFTQLAFMNYFQRPAEVTGDSIQVSSLDRQVSAQTVEEVVRVLQPRVVVFCSRLAWRAAGQSGLVAALIAAGQVVGHTPHPASAWWHRPSRKRQGRNGRTEFIELLRQATTSGPASLG